MQAGLVPRPLAVTTWLRRHRDRAPRFLGEFAVGLGSAQLALWLVGVLGGLSVLGAIRGATVLIGPFRILLIAAPGAAIPELVRIRNTSVRRFTRAVALISWTLAVLIGAWGVFVYLLPDRLGEAILGDSWDAAQSVLLWVTLSWSALGVATGALVGLRVLAAARRSFRARLVIAPAVLLVAVIGVEAGGLRGAAGRPGPGVVWLRRRLDAPVPRRARRRTDDGTPEPGRTAHRTAARHPGTLVIGILAAWKPGGMP